MLTTIRVLFGFALACLVAGAATVAFVISPTELMTLPESVRYQRLGLAGELTLAAATQTALFSGAFALVAAAIAEWQSIRGAMYYVFAGVLIAAGGFLALWAGEAFTLENTYAMLAYLAAGLAGGLTYWLFAGRLAGDPMFDDAPTLQPVARETPRPATASRPATEAGASPGPASADRAADKGGDRGRVIPRPDAVQPPPTSAAPATADAKPSPAGPGGPGREVPRSASGSVPLTAPQQPAAAPLAASPAPRPATGPATAPPPSQAAGAGPIKT